MTTQHIPRDLIDERANLARLECGQIANGASRFVSEHITDPADVLAKVFKITADGIGDLGRADDAEIGRRIRELVVEPAWRRAGLAEFGWRVA